MIVVTGAAGRLGRFVVGRLIDRGYEVRATDRVPFDESPTEFVEADLCDSDRVDEVLKGAAAVIHMGAIPGPAGTGWRGTQPETRRELFDNNLRSTFNVMMTAEEMSIRRVVFSSSAFGMGWAHDPSAFEPLYLPLDEDHPMMPFEPYGMSKQVGEVIGAMVARSSSTSVASLRFTNVVRPEVLAELPWPAPTRAKPLTLVMWAYADAGDVAEAHVLAMEADLTGHEAFLLAQPTTRFREPTAELIAANFGSMVEIRGKLEGNASVISSTKAQRVLGWKPRSTWS